MKILISLLMIISINGCSIFGRISDETDLKIAFLQSIVDNPELIDSLVDNSVFNHKDIPAYWVNNIRLDLFKHKGVNLNLYLNYKRESWSNHLTNRYKINYQIIGVLFDDSDMGLFAGFQLIDNKWYINDIYYISKEQMDNFEEPRDLIPTITN